LGIYYEPVLEQKNLNATMLGDTAARLMQQLLGLDRPGGAGRRRHLQDRPLPPRSTAIINKCVFEEFQFSDDVAFRSPAFGVLLVDSQVDLTIQQTEFRNNKLFDDQAQFENVRTRTRLFPSCSPRFFFCFVSRLRMISHERALLPPLYVFPASPNQAVTSAVGSGLYVSRT
jgi:hypothetical protein